MPLFGPPDAAKLRARGDVAGLVKLMAYPKSWDVRQSAALALVPLGAPAVAPLIGALAHPDGSVRQLGAQALGRIGDARAVEPLIVALQDPDPSVRQAAATALGAIGDPRAIEPLLVAYGRPGSVGYGDREKSVRESAGQALEQLRMAHLDPFIAALASDDRNRRLAAALTIVHIPLSDRLEARALEPLLEALDDPDGNVAAYACLGLGSIGDPRAFAPLVTRLGHPDSRVSDAAGRALLEIGAPAVDALVAALGDPSAAVRSGAAWTLNALRWRGPESFVEMRWQPQSDATGARYFAARGAWDACADIGAPAVEPLIAVLAEHDFEPSARQALVQVGEPAVMPLIAALGSGHWRVRRAATQALGEIGDPRAVDPLLATLGDPDTSTFDRKTIGKALGLLGIEVDIGVAPGDVDVESDGAPDVGDDATVMAGARPGPEPTAAPQEATPAAPPPPAPGRPATPLRVNLGDVPRETLESIVLNDTALTIAQGTAVDDVTPDLARHALAARAHEARADALARDGHFEEAAREYREAIESAPYDDEVLYMSLGGVLSAMRHHAEALASLEIAVRINPVNDDVIRNLAICRANVAAEAG